MSLNYLPLILSGIETFDVGSNVLTVEIGRDATKFVNVIPPKSTNAHRRTNLIEGSYALPLTLGGHPFTLGSHDVLLLVTSNGVHVSIQVDDAMRGAWIQHHGDRL